MRHSTHQAFRYMLINQCEFLDNARGGGRRGKEFHPQEIKHSILWEKNLLVIIKQLQSKPYQGEFCQLNTSCPQSRWHRCHDKLQHNNNLSGTGCVPDNYFGLGSALYRVFQKQTTQHINTHLLSFSNQK